MDGPSLPRSIRWRLQLGVFSLPKQDDGNKKTWNWNELWSCNSQTCQGLRWDYTRLQQEWNEFYQKQQQQEDEKDDDNEEEDYVQLSSQAVDPLTAMLQEQTAQEERLEQLELKYKKEKALRKRGLYNDAAEDSQAPLSEHEYSSFSSSLGLIEKDLNRLPRDHHEYHYKRLTLNKSKSVEYAEAVEERTLRLTEMLQIYAKQHPHIGYRQGMHELISYCLLVIEMDIYQYEKSKKKKSQQSDSNTATNNSSNVRNSPSFWKDGIEQEFWDSSYIAHDAYSMFQILMDPLAPAYDVNPTAISQEPILPAAETRGQTILESIRTIASDEVLYHHLMDLQCPPELYTTRWIRLLFSREVHGNLNVLLLWDVFLDLWSTTSKVSSLHPSRYTRPGVSPPLQLGHWNLLEILETTAASMILLQRSSLLQLGDACDASHSDSIHRLMNIPPLKNILPLTATVLSMMRRRQVQDTNPTTTTSPNSTKKSVVSRPSQMTQMSSSSASNRNVFSDMADAVEKFSVMWGNNSSSNQQYPNKSSSGSGPPDRNSNQIDKKQNHSVRNYPGTNNTPKVVPPKRSSIDKAMAATMIAKSTANLFAPETSTTSVSSSSDLETTTTTTENDDLDKKVHGTTQRSSSFSSSQREIVLSSQLSDAIFTMKQYLLQVEIRSTDGNLVPSSVWSALEQMESVQKELRHTPNSNTMRGNDFE